MTVTAQVPEQYTTATAGATVFPFGFKIFKTSDLVVKVDGVAKTLTTDYTVTGAGSASGGNVVFVSAMAGGEVVSILRDVPLERDVDYQEGGDLPAATHNADHDAPWMAIQQLQRDLGAASSAGSLVWDRGDWVTITDYSRNDSVTHSSARYRCVIPHTSGVFATDLAAGKWAALLDLSGFSMAGGLNEARGNITQHATTMDFFATTSPNVLDGTGSAVTITACANAPQAGASRKFYPLANTILTHGATFDIDGNASVTAAAGDCWEIVAKTVSTYKVHVWKDDASMPAPGAIGDTTPNIVRGTNREVFKTASGTLTAAECSGTIVSNYGMTDADCTIDLPTAAEGLAFVCILPAVRARFFKLHCPTAQADKIYLNGVAGSDDGNVGVASGYVTGAAASFFTFKASDGGYDWFCIPIYGTWVAS